MEFMDSQSIADDRARCQMIALRMMAARVAHDRDYLRFVPRIVRPNVIELARQMRQEREARR